ncbi:LacI family DNA-binding transcriptional regulator [Neptunomonas antarctica]|uniref:Transcriptional regulator, LacI family n=1 Tax=Neptunomonas antarctica TaxID=619304 RepID=A0A1N7L1D0_9GAMM|nr:LacI family DNA-binding transcriptional regulator [Neptunomonas antarctica]SIS67601.1 transcriptional regulator, LacI family [Neptunomonas antarctica]
MKAHNIRAGNPTMEDVARTAGLASVTVSRYLNNPDLVSERSKQKISDAISLLKYVPHAAARALASNRSRLIGAIVPSLDNNLFGLALEVFQDHISKAGYTLIVASNNYNAEKEREHINQMVSHGVDALFLIGNSRDEAIYQLLQAKEIPYVLTWTVDPRHQHPCIGFNNHTAAATVTDYLLDLGHQKIAMISGFVKNNDRAYERLQGVRDALGRRGLILPDEYLIEGPFGVERGREAFRLLMSRPQPPTAVICGSEPFAYGAIFESKHLGIDIPRQVSITGFDDMWLASSISPRLTTVRTPQQQMGVLAAKYLVSKLKGEDVPTPHPLETELIVRESCAPPV